MKKVEPVETNIIIFEIDTDLLTPEKFIDLLLDHGVHLIGMGQGKLRMVTHLDYTDQNAHFGDGYSAQY